MSNSEDPREKFRRLMESEAETQSEPSVGDTEPVRRTQVAHRPPIKKNTSPLPRRVGEVDMDATRVSPSAFEKTADTRGRRGTADRGGSGSGRHPARRSNAGGCFLQGLIISAFLAVTLGLILVAVGVYEY